MIRVTGLVVRFGEVRAVDVPSFEIEDGARIGVRGPNGSGKSTFMRVLAGLIAPSEGRAQGLPPPGRAVLVHQRPYLFRGTARDNVAYALRMQRRPRREAMTWLARLGAEHLADRRARNLSVGERRRVAIARALAARPALLLLDEPFAALDAAGERALEDVLAAFEGTLVVAAPALDPDSFTRVLDLA